MMSATARARPQRSALVKRRAVAVVALVLMARLLLPCFPAQANPGSDDAIFILCTPNGFVDLRSLYPQEDGFAPQTQEERQTPVPADGGIFQVCSGFCGLSLPLHTPDQAFPVQALAERMQRFEAPDSRDLPSSELRYDLTARGPPAFSS